MYLKSIISKCSNLLTSSVRFNRLQTLSEKCRINQNLDVLEKQMRYVLMARKSSMQIGEKPSMISALFGLGSTFLNYYFLRLGFLDGTHGFFAASSRAQGKFWTKSQISPMPDSMKVAGKFEDESPQKNQ